MRTKPWLPFNSKISFFWLVLVFFISPSFWPFWVFSDKDTFSNWRHAVISPDVKFSIHALDSPWIVVFYRVFDFFNTTCQCIFIGDWNRPIFSEKNDFWRKNWSRDHTFCLISSKRLKKTYVSLYKILFALSRRFDWYIIWWGFLKKKMATFNMGHVTSTPLFQVFPWSDFLTLWLSESQSGILLIKIKKLLSPLNPRLAGSVPCLYAPGTIGRLRVLHKPSNWSNKSNFTRFCPIGKKILISRVFAGSVKKIWFHAFLPDRSKKYEFTRFCQGELFSKLGNPE